MIITDRENSPFWRDVTLYFIQRLSLHTHHNRLWEIFYPHGKHKRSNALRVQYCMFVYVREQQHQS
jgi:hypothetical protein